MAGAEKSKLATQLERSARVLEDTLSSYAERLPQIGSTPFANELWLALAAMETLARKLEGPPPQRETALHITLTLARDAAEAARGQGFDEATLRVAATCDAVAMMCEAALDVTF